jgi:hypothetical protein
MVEEPTQPIKEVIDKVENKSSFETTYHKHQGTDAPRLNLKDFERLEMNREAFFTSEINNGNSGTAKTIDWKLGNKQKITFTGDATLTFLPPTGVCNLILRCIEDGTARTITFPATVKWDGSAPTFTGTLNKWYIIALYFDGTNYSASATGEIG